MFQFSAFAYIYDIPSVCQVTPFGNLRINSHMPIPAAYRSLSRPSSPLRAKASPVCPYLLSSPCGPFATAQMLVGYPTYPKGTTSRTITGKPITTQPTEPTEHTE